MKPKRAVGDIITRSGPPPLERDYPVVESILENNRPCPSIPRTESVNMREGRDFGRLGIETDDGYVHELEPQGLLEERDVTWIGVLQARWPKNGMVLKDKYPDLTDDQVAKRYWDGTRSDEPWVEHVCKEAKVIAVESELSPVRLSKWAAALEKVKAYSNIASD